MIRRWRRALADLHEEARSVRDLASEIGSFAVERLRERYLARPARVEPLRAIVDVALAEISGSLIEAKKGVAVAIAD
jgi:hypothetical protein